MNQPTHDAPMAAERLAEISAAIAALDAALKRGADVLDLTIAYAKGDVNDREFVLLVSEEVSCDDVLGTSGPEVSTIAFAEAATLAGGIVLLAERMAEAGYGAVVS